MIETSYIGLQLGCQYHPIQGWLNTDIEPLMSCIEFLDAGKVYPFEDNTFKFVFSEHMLEHLEPNQGYTMISECHRVLKRGGVLRLALPTKEFIDRIYNNPEDYKEYLDWFLSTHCKEYPVKTPAMFANVFYRKWEHKTIYDKPTLIEMFRSVGFSKIEEKNVYESEYRELQNLEQHAKEIGEYYNKIETIIFECTK